MGIEQNMVGPGYFSILQVPLLQGRPILATDTPESDPVAVINQTMALRLWPDGTALGRTFRYHDRRVTIVGIARDAKYASLTEPTPLMVYFPLAQQWRAHRFLLVRSRVPCRRHGTTRRAGHPGDGP